MTDEKAIKTDTKAVPVKKEEEPKKAVVTPKEPEKDVAKVEKKEPEQKVAKSAAKEEVKTERIPELRPGYTIKVYQHITEGEKQRIQIFEGIILAMQGKTETDRTMTVRKISHGVGVEKIFPLSLPSIEKIVIVKKAKVRRSKLYYLRNYGKRLKEVFMK